MSFESQGQKNRGRPGCFLDVMTYQYQCGKELPPALQSLPEDRSFWDSLSYLFKSFGNDTPFSSFIVKSNQASKYWLNDSSVPNTLLGTVEGQRDVHLVLPLPSHVAFSPGEEGFQARWCCTGLCEFLIATITTPHLVVHNNTATSSHSSRG